MKLSPVHPGEILNEEFLSPMELSQYRLAKEIDVPARRINEIVHGKRSISADSAIRFASYFGTSEMFWMQLQAAYDLDVERLRRADAGTKRSTPARPVARRGTSQVTPARTSSRSPRVTARSVRPDSRKRRG
jgi:antitoxin HigA-1